MDKEKLNNETEEKIEKTEGCTDASNLCDACDTEKSEGNCAETDSVETRMEQLVSELEKEKKEYLFLMAEFDNFRKRNLRERAELVKNAAESAFKGLLPIIDDFERGLEAAADAKEAEAVAEGMRLIYNKLIKYLEKNGVKQMLTNGEPFDAEMHEAVAMIPAQSDDMKGKIIDTVERGYTINDKVLRHAKVAVAQ